VIPSHGGEEPTKLTPAAQPPAPSQGEHPAPSPASPEPVTDRAARHGAELWTRVCDIVKRRRLRLIAIAVTAGLLAAISGGVWTWLLPPSGGLRASAAFVVGLWLALVGAGATLVVLADQRPRRRITLLSSLAVAMVVLCCVPAGWF